MIRRAALLALSLAVASCARPDAASEPRSLAVLRVGAVPLLEIGVVEGDEHYTFQDVTGVLPLPSGDVVVADGGAGELTRYAADGTFVRRWGRRGQGPGEFGSLSRVYPWTGDSVAALDQANVRVSVFGPDGGFSRQIDAHTLSGDTLFAMDVWLYGRFWVDGAVDAAARSRVRAALDRLPAPPSPPGWRYARVAADQRVWVREPGVEPDGRRRWTVLDPSGTPSAVATTPARFDPRYLGADRVVGRWRDGNDVNFVRGYALERTGETRPAPVWLSAAAERTDVPPPEEAEFLATIRTAIKRMASAQEIHYASHYSYTSETDSLEWEAPEGVLVDFVDAGTRGWTAVFTHPGFDRICGLSYGADVPPGWQPGHIVCGAAASSGGEG